MTKTSRKLLEKKKQREEARHRGKTSTMFIVLANQ